ncbi:hypothetical protein [Kocuria sp. CPCC 205297]|uniref:hypothetical protein n=1 Tax=Kocuria sp. CPCC 205297 TaxID=3073558 RepID=UPI0034D4D7DD
MKTWLIHHPWFDFVIAGSMALLALLVGKAVDMGIATTTRTAVAGAVSAFAGIAVAAEIFAFSHLYASTSERLQRILAAGDNAKVMASNWISSLVGTVGSAVAAILVLIVSDALPTLALSTLLGATGLTALGLCRAIYWLDFTLLQHRVEQQVSVDPRPPGVPTKSRRTPRQPEKI